MNGFMSRNLPRFHLRPADYAGTNWDGLCHCCPADVNHIILSELVVLSAADLWPFTFQGFKNEYAFPRDTRLKKKA